MLTTGALALVVVIFVGIVYVEADDHTYVVNKATVGMLATTSYGSGDSEFINRDVEPGAQGVITSSLPRTMHSHTTMCNCILRRFCERVAATCLIIINPRALVSPTPRPGRLIVHV